MKFLKKQKDYYALCYIYNWLVLLIGPPLSFFALILLAFGFGQAFSTGQTSSLESGILLVFLFLVLIGIYGIFYLVMWFKSLRNSLKTGKSSFFAAPISLIMTMICQLPVFILICKGFNLLSQYRSEIFLGQLYSVLTFSLYLYCQYGRKGKKSNKILYLSQVINFLLVFLLTYRVYYPIFLK